MGGFHKSIGQVYKPIRKIVDPLNIMDPFRILPGSSAGFTKKGAFTLDPNFGGPLKKMLGGGGGGGSYTPMTKGLPSNAQYFQQQQQMLQNMQAGSDLNIAKRKGSNARLASSNPSIASSPTEITKVTSEPLIIPIDPQINQTRNQQIPSASNLAQTKITDNIAPSDLPMDFSYKPPTTASKVSTANTFLLPNLSDIKFGGA
jgi:hypothetical protein